MRKKVSIRRKVRTIAAWILCTVLIGCAGQAYAGAETQKAEICDAEDRITEDQTAKERETEDQTIERQAADEKQEEEQEKPEEEPGMEQAAVAQTEAGPENVQSKENNDSTDDLSDKETGEKELEEELEERYEGNLQEEESDTGEVSADEESVFYIQEHSPKIATRSFNNASMLPVSHVRYDHFQAVNSNANTADSPNLGVGIKYIQGDDKNVDGGGKWRYVYCLQFSKESPGNGAAMQYVGWANRKVSYALYYGAVYYGYMCRYSPYSTGNWQMDYFVTQMAVHILNNEFTMAAFRRGLNRSAATQAEKDLVYNRVNLMVNDANNSRNYGGFTSDGWLDMNTGSFSLSSYQDTWTLNGGNYISGGVFHPVYRSYYGYDFCEQITGCEIQVPQGVSVRKKSSRTYADFDLAIMESQYGQWQLTGKTIPVTVKITIPRYWGGGIYRCPSSSVIQDVCFLTWGSEGGTAVFTQTANLHIPKVTRDLTLYKKDARSGQALSGALFSLWAYDGKAYSKKVGTFQDQHNGSYLLYNIDYSTTMDGKFLIKEERPPVSYNSDYQPENTADAQDLEQYGGRTVKMNADGFSSDKVAQPFIFKDEKLIPQANISVMKYDIDTGRNLSGAEFAAYEWDNQNGCYQDTPIRTLVYDTVNQRYVTEEPLFMTDGNGGKFLIRETKTPDGYHCGWSEEILISEPGAADLELTAPNYPGRNFTFVKTIRRDEINWEHGNPTFFFRLWGTDLDGVKHQYYCHVEFTSAAVAKQEGEFVTQKAVIRDIPAGTYQAEETGDSLRYILTAAGTPDKNVRVETAAAGTVNEIRRITASVTADLRTGDGSVNYENRKVLYDELSDNAVVTNHFVFAPVKKEG